MNSVFEKERDEAVSALQIVLKDTKLMEEKLTSVQVCVPAFVALFDPHVPSCLEGRVQRAYCNFRG